MALIVDHSFPVYKMSACMATERDIIRDVLLSYPREGF